MKYRHLLFMFSLIVSVFIGCTKTTCSIDTDCSTGYFCGTDKACHELQAVIAFDKLKDGDIITPASDTSPVTPVVDLNIQVNVLSANTESGHLADGTGMTLTVTGASTQTYSGTIIADKVYFQNIPLDQGQVTITASLSHSPAVVTKVTVQVIDMSITMQYLKGGTDPAPLQSAIITDADNVSTIAGVFKILFSAVTVGIAEGEKVDLYVDGWDTKPISSGTVFQNTVTFPAASIPLQKTIAMRVQTSLFSKIVTFSLESTHYCTFNMNIASNAIFGIADNERAGTPELYKTLSLDSLTTCGEGSLVEIYINNAGSPSYTGTFEGATYQQMIALPESTSVTDLSSLRVVITDQSTGLSGTKTADNILVDLTLPSGTVTYPHQNQELTKADSIDPLIEGIKINVTGTGSDNLDPNPEVQLILYGNVQGEGVTESGAFLIPLIFLVTDPNLVLHVTLTDNAKNTTYIDIPLKVYVNTPKLSFFTVCGSPAVNNMWVTSAICDIILKTEDLSPSTMTVSLQRDGATPVVQTIDASGFTTFSGFILYNGANDLTALLTDAGRERKAELKVNVNDIVPEATLVQPVPYTGGGQVEIAYGYADNTVAPPTDELHFSPSSAIKLQIANAEAGTVSVVSSVTGGLSGTTSVPITFDSGSGNYYATFEDLIVKDTNLTGQTNHTLTFTIKESPAGKEGEYQLILHLDLKKPVAPSISGPNLVYDPKLAKINIKWTALSGNDETKMIEYQTRYQLYETTCTLSEANFDTQNTDPAISQPLTQFAHATSGFTPDGNVIGAPAGAAEQFSFFVSREKVATLTMPPATPDAYTIGIRLEGQASKALGSVVSEITVLTFTGGGIPPLHPEDAVEFYEGTNLRGAGVITAETLSSLTARLTSGVVAPGYTIVKSGVTPAEIATVTLTYINLKKVRGSFQPGETVTGGIKSVIPSAVSSEEADIHENGAKYCVAFRALNGIYANDKTILATNKGTVALNDKGAMELLPTQLIPPNPGSDYTFIRVKPVGDITGDGILDFSVGNSTMNGWDGYVVVFSGADFSKIFEKGMSGAYGGEGQGISGGDFNCDNKNDFAYYDYYGKVHIYYGTGTGLDTAHPLVFTAKMTGTGGDGAQPDGFGAVYGDLAGIDLNDDGCTDLAVGMNMWKYNGNSKSGATFVYYGNTAKSYTGENPDLQLYGTAPNQMLGVALRKAGRLNNKGESFITSSASTPRTVLVYANAYPSGTPESGLDTLIFTNAGIYAAVRIGFVNMNQDVYDDLLVAVYDQVRIYYGSTTGIGDQNRYVYLDSSDILEYTFDANYQFAANVSSFNPSIDDFPAGEFLTSGWDGDMYVFSGDRIEEPALGTIFPVKASYTQPLLYSRFSAFELFDPVLLLPYGYLWCNTAAADGSCSIFKF